MNGTLQITNFDDLIFLKKNKEYGAYILRQNYKKFLIISMFIAVFIVLLVVTGPTIYRMINPEKVEAKKTTKVVITELAPPPSISEERKVEQIEAPPPLKSTIKFTPPVVKPDDAVRDDYVPTVDELQNVDPGLKTEKGSETGIDYTLLDQETVVEEKKDETPQYFIAVEEMPEPVGGIAAIQSKIVYPDLAKRAGVEGKVYVMAFVDEKGTVTNAKLIKGIGAGCDEAAVQAVKSTRFKPGKQRGTPVKVQVSIPIVFKLQ